MGLTNVPVSLRAFGERNGAFTAEFLVDTGAIDSLAPGASLRKIGVKPEGKESYRLADETVQEFEFGVVRIEFGGQVTAGRVIFGPDDAQPLLGATALESAGFTVDPGSQTLKKLPSISLK